MVTHPYLVCMFVLGTVPGRDMIEEETQVIALLLGGGSEYDPSVRPGGANTSDGPTEVFANLYVRNFEEVDVAKMDYTVDITLRQVWFDPRLQYNSTLPFITLPREDLVWRPDTFFRNAKEAQFHHVTTKQFYVRVFPDGNLLYSLRLKVKLVCPMNLKLYPFDTQMCRAQLASYSSSTKSLIYHWKKTDPVQLRPDVYGYILMGWQTERCDVKTSTGEYSCISVEFKLERNSSYYVLTIYTPYSMLVCISWLAFWVDQKNMLTRVGITLSVLLIMSEKNERSLEKVPNVGYTKAVDIWTGMCTMFVFFALLTCVLVNCVSEDEETNDGDENNKKLTRFKNAPLGVKIDLLSRILFPTIFVLFNIIYWSSYVHA